MRELLHVPVLMTGQIYIDFINRLIVQPIWEEMGSISYLWTTGLLENVKLKEWSIGLPFQLNSLRLNIPQAAVE